MTDGQAHWNSAYSTKGDNVSWFQIEPARSLDMIRAAAPMHGVPIIDIGAGASRLADNLISAGYSDLTLLDISQVALARTMERLGGVPDKITWIAADVTQWKPSRKYEVWHDRAVFHFLTAPGDRVAYVRQVARAVKNGGYVIVSTFGPEGPTKCSGLEVVRYDAESLHREFGVHFRLLGSSNELHQTPFGTTQQFLYCYCRVE